MKNFGQLVFLLAGLLAISVACSSKNGEKQGADASQSVVVSQRQTQYLHLTGTVGDLPVTFNLMREASPYDTGWFYHGYYYYDAYESLISLYGSVDSTGQVVLTEVSNWEQTPNTFVGTFAADNSFSGTWKAGDNTRELAFKLMPAQGMLAFTHRAYADSLAGLPDNPRSPKSFFRFDWMEASSADQALNTFVNDAIRSGLLGDSLANIYKDLNKAIEALKKDYFANYRTEVQGMLAEGIIDTTEEMNSLNYETDQSVFIYYNTPKLLTVGYNSYYYTGGAHGMHGTSVYSYDLESRKEINIEDVLKPGYENKLGAALAKAVRSRYQLTANQPLSEILFEDQVAPNENFGLTSKGIFFVYAPYEIAAYAAGEIELFVPFNDIKALLQPAFVSKMAL